MLIRFLRKKSLIFYRFFDPITIIIDVNCVEIKIISNYDFSDFAVRKQTLPIRRAPKIKSIMKALIFRDVEKNADRI